MIIKKFLAVTLICVMALGCSIDKELTNRSYETEIQSLEKNYNANIGIYALDTSDGKIVEYNADKRFAYCSTHKVFTAAEILKRHSSEEMQEVIHFNQEDILSYAPVTKNHVEDGMTLFEICESAVRLSDNTAANLMLIKLGGVEEFKKMLRNIDDEVTNPVRFEPELNEFIPNSDSDTSTPRQLNIDLQKYLLGDILNSEQKQILIDWMSNNKITDELIRAGVPNDWKVIDKSGNGTYGTRNDIAVVYPKDSQPIVIVIMSNHDDELAKYDNKLISDVTKIIIKQFNTFNDK